MLLPNIPEWRGLYTLSFMVVSITTHVSCLSVRMGREPTYDRQAILTSYLRYRLKLSSNTTITLGTDKPHCCNACALSSAKSTPRQRRLPHGVKSCLLSLPMARTMSRCCQLMRLTAFSKYRTLKMEAFGRTLTLATR